MSKITEFSMILLSFNFGFGPLYFNIPCTTDAKYVYRECRAKWSEWMVNKTYLIHNIPNIPASVTQRNCTWFIAPCIRNRQCPCEMYYPLELSNVQLPRKRNHICVQKKTCDVLICSSVVLKGSTISSSKLVLKSYHFEGKQNKRKPLVGIIYVPLDYNTQKTYEKNKVQSEESGLIESEEYMVMDVSNNSIHPVHAKSSYPSANSHNISNNTNRTENALTLTGIVLLPLLFLILVIFSLFKILPNTRCFTRTYLQNYHLPKEYDLSCQS
ncbi:unnamed protein product [Trichobilharzia szidati]|nr:unnamed protein product [Trichobilharzia szidati]